MYYVIDCVEPDDPDEDDLGYYELDESLTIAGISSWSIGQKFSVAVPKPLIIPITAEDECDGDPLELYDYNIPLMTSRLKEAFTAAGVDNIDFYDAILRDSENNKEFHYFAFNVIGLVSAVDLRKSSLSSFDGDYKIDSSIRGMTIDKTRTQNLLCFRLLENVKTLVVHEKIKNSIENMGVDTIVFYEPNDYVQI